MFQLECWVSFLLCFDERSVELCLSFKEEDKRKEMGKKKEKVIQRVQNVIPIQKEKQKNILMINIPSCIFFLSWSVFWALRERTCPTSSALPSPQRGRYAGALHPREPFESVLLCTTKSELHPSGNNIRIRFDYIIRIAAWPRAFFLFLSKQQNVCRTGTVSARRFYELARTSTNKSQPVWSSLFNAWNTSGERSIEGAL